MRREAAIATAKTREGLFRGVDSGGGRAVAELKRGAILRGLIQLMPIDHIAVSRVPDQVDPMVFQLGIEINETLALILESPAKKVDFFLKLFHLGIVFDYLSAQALNRLLDFGRIELSRDDDEFFESLLELVAMFVAAGHIPRDATEHRSPLEDLLGGYDIRLNVLTDHGSRVGYYVARILKADSCNRNPLGAI